MRILFLCNKSPWPPKEGGPMAMNMLITGLIRAGHFVRVLAVNSYKYNIHPEDIPSDYRQMTGLRLVDVDLRVRPVAALLNLFTSRSYHVERFISAAFRKELTGMLTEGRFDIVQMETVFMSPYIETIRQHSKARIVLRAHNIEHMIWQRVAEETRNPLKRFYLQHLTRTLKQYELSILPAFDGIAAITPTDAGFFRNILEHTASPVANHTISIGFGINPDAYPAPDDPGGFPSLFTLGSMNWIPNQEGIRWFLQEVWPDIHKQFPSLKYYLAGREMPEWMINLTLPNVVVVGEVEDARAFIASKSVMIVPLFSGSGIRIKIIEGMALSRPVISTSIGAEGISCTHGENILIANLPCEFFEMVSICVTDQHLCKRIGSNARRFVEQHYNQDAIIQKLAGFYEQLPG
jgi:glycosyltransferase involved in cell wall biosynthesis